MLVYSNFAAVSALVPIGKELTLRQLVFWPLLVNCGLLVAEAVLALLPALGGKAVMLVTIYSAGITGATTACLQAGSFVVASRFPALYMQVLHKRVMWSASRHACSPCPCMRQATPCPNL